MKIRDVINSLESFAPPELQESYDNSGLNVGNANDDLKGIIISVDVTSEVISEAIEKKCNLVITHHPLIFSPLKKIIYSSFHGKIIFEAIKNNISIYSIHTNADSITGGVSSALADKIGLINQKILVPRKSILKKLVTFCPEKDAENVRTALFNAGAGKIGEYDSCSFNAAGTGSFKANEKANPYVGKKNEIHFEPEIRIETIFPSYLKSKVIDALFKTHPYEEVAYDIYSLDNEFDKVGFGVMGFLENEIPCEEFPEMIKSLLKITNIKYTNGTGGNIRKVAVCGGSGSFLINNAISENIDALITADIKYHDFQNASGKILLIDIGHYESEQYIKDVIYSFLLQKFNNFAVYISNINTNPVKYL